VEIVGMIGPEFVMDGRNDLRLGIFIMKELVKILFGMIYIFQEKLNLD